MKLKELEKRLKHEPSNLGLRVQVAGLLREAGRSVEAVEHYRMVAIAYRDQGRTQQAIMVCRNILEIAPEDMGCQGLLASLQGRSPSMPSLPTPAPGELRPDRAANPRVITTAPISVPSMPSISTSEPVRRDSVDETPLPKPMPYHEADRTSQPPKVSAREIRERTTRPSTGLAQAARHISGLFSTATSPGIPNKEMDLSAELDTRQRPKIRAEELRKITEADEGNPDERATPPRRYAAEERVTPPRPFTEEDLPTGQIEGLLTPPPRASEDAMTPPPAKGPNILSPTQSITMRRLPPMPKPRPGSTLTIPPRHRTRDTDPDASPRDTHREPLRREPKETHIGPPTRDTHREPFSRDTREVHRGPPKPPPPPRGAMPKIPTSRDSEEMTVPHTRSPLDDDDDDDTEV